MKAAAVEVAQGDDAADQLMDLAETLYASYFPGPRSSANAEGYRYRYYPRTGTYLGVRDGRVYVLGGVFGSAPVDVGRLVDFLVPEAGASQSPCTRPGRSYDIRVTTSSTAGRNAAAVVLGCTGEIESPQWRQTEGPALTLTTARSQAISFDPPAPGRYAFELTFKLGASTYTEQVSLQVGAAAPGAALTLRSSQTVRAGGPVSVRAWPALDSREEPEITWTQISGPRITLDTSASRLAVFTAPAVTHDELIRLRGTARLASGEEVADDVMVVVAAHPQAAAADDKALFAGLHLPAVTPYVTPNPWATALSDCVVNTALQISGPGINLCTLLRLPYLGQEAGSDMPRLESVRLRLMVQHEWQGRNLERFLQTYDAAGDFRRMLSSVTAVVVSGDSRGSYYNPYTGAVHLSAHDLWLTPEERDTLTETSFDVRSVGLQYDFLWRYVEGGRDATQFYDSQRRVSRPLEALRVPMSGLLYHMLTYPISYLPPSEVRAQIMGQRAVDILLARRTNPGTAAGRLGAKYALSTTDPLLRELAKVQVGDRSATVEERAVPIDRVITLFSQDGSNDHLSHLGLNVDLANLVEEFMMAHRLKLRRDVAITDPIGVHSTASNVLVRWGERGRIGSPLVRKRVEFVVSDLLTWIDPAAVAQVPDAQAMVAGQSWAASVGSNPAVGFSTGGGARQRQATSWTR